MSDLNEARTYLLAHLADFWSAVGEHMTLSLAALAISVLICIPLGIIISQRINLAQWVITAFGALRLIPSLAVLFLALPYLGLGFPPSLFALTLLACPPVLINTYAGIRNVDRAVVEAATGMGMARSQVLRQIELPLALPSIITGIRTAAVEVVSSATLASFINGGGLGEFVQIGFALNNTGIMLVGAVPVALLALAAELLFSGLTRLSTTPTA